MKMILSSFVFLMLESAVVSTTPSCGWLNILSFRFFNTVSTSCSTLMHSFAFIPLMEYDVLFPSILVSSFILGVLVCYLLYCILPRFFFSFKCLSFGFVFSIYLRQKRAVLLFFICDIRGRCYHLNGCCLYVFSDFETDLLRNFKFQSG